MDAREHQAFDSRSSADVLSLFCGCGGLDLGFAQAGFGTALAYDRRSASLASWNHNFEEGVALSRDIEELTLAQMDTDFGSEFRPTAVIGGPPCQGFSLANRSGAADDPRNLLVERFIDLAMQLDERSPLDFIVMENVPAIIGKRGRSIVERQSKKLRSRGFQVSQAVLDAVHFGVPQSRRRFFLVAIKSSGETHNSWIEPEPLSNTITVKQAIGELPRPIYFNSGLAKEDIPYHPNHWCMRPKSSKFSSGELHEGYVQKRSFKTLKWDKPSYTAAYGNREVHVHPDCTRRLSVLEAMIIQGFPLSFELLGTLSEQVTQVSEAVPPPLAKAVAISVRQCILARSDRFPYLKPAIHASYPISESSTG